MWLSVRRAKRATLASVSSAVLVQTKGAPPALCRHASPGTGSTGCVTLYFTPTCPSWLNQVELWFSYVQRDAPSPDIFTSTADLARKLQRYIGAYAKRARCFRWQYANPARHTTHDNFREGQRTG